LFCYYVCVHCAVLPAKVVPEMTYIVSGGTLNSTHSLIEANRLQHCPIAWSV